MRIIPFVRKEKEMDAEMDSKKAKLQVVRHNRTDIIAPQTERTILIADDAEDTRMIVSHSLEFDGFNCIQAKDGREVLELTEIHRPRLIVLDLMLPHLNGFQVLLRLQNSDLKPKVCVISAFDKPNFVRRAFEFGADDYLVKPVMPELLSYKVNTILNDDPAESFFGINSDLRAKIKCGENTFTCKIHRISEVGLSIISAKIPNNSGLLTLQSKELQKIFQSDKPIFLKRSLDNKNNSYALSLDFVALSDYARDRLKDLVSKGRFLSSASFHN